MTAEDEKQLRMALLNLWRAETAYVQSYGQWASAPGPDMDARLLEAEHRMESARLLAMKLEADKRSL